MKAIRKITKKIERTGISIGNLIQDLKSFYEDIVSEEIVSIKTNSNNVYRIQLNETEYIQLTKWRDKNYYDLIHVKRDKNLFKGAICFKEDSVELEAVFELNFGFLTNESKFTDLIYDKK